MAHTNGIESHWAMLKRGYVGVYHQMSAKHLPRYVAEFEGRHNSRSLDTDEQMARMAKRADGQAIDVSGPNRQGINMSETPNNLPVPLNFEQQPMLIEHAVDGEVIPQRPRDGYINATILCQQTGKRFNDYYRLGQTQDYLNELRLETGIPVSNLVQIIRGRGDKLQQGPGCIPK